MVGKSQGLAFGMLVGRALEIGRSAAVELAVVRDPLEEKAPAQGWDGHALLEGLSRPAGASKLTFRKLRAALAEACQLIE